MTEVLLLMSCCGKAQFFLGLTAEGDTPQGLPLCTLARPHWPSWPSDTSAHACLSAFAWLSSLLDHSSPETHQARILPYFSAPTTPAKEGF